MIYTCHEGFVLDGDSFLECGTDRKLQGKMPLCSGSGNLFLALLESALSLFWGGEVRDGHVVAFAGLSTSMSLI